MRKVALIILCLVAITSKLELNAAWRVRKLGDFPIVGSVKNKGFILDDGNIYKPIDSVQKKITHEWQLGDGILLLRGKGRNRFILVNIRTGQKARMKGVRW